MWWGLKVDGELEVVIRANYEPTIWDFHFGWCSWRDYEVVRVDVVEI